MKSKNKQICGFVFHKQKVEPFSSNLLMIESFQNLSQHLHREDSHVESFHRNPGILGISSDTRLDGKLNIYGFMKLCLGEFTRLLLSSQNLVIGEETVPVFRMVAIERLRQRSGSFHTVWFTKNPHSHSLLANRKSSLHIINFINTKIVVKIFLLSL